MFKMTDRPLLKKSFALKKPRCAIDVNHISLKINWCNLNIIQSRDCFKITIQTLLLPFFSVLLHT